METNTPTTPTGGEGSTDVLYMNKLLTEKAQRLEKENEELKEQIRTLKGIKSTRGRAHRHPKLKPSEKLFVTHAPGIFTLVDGWRYSQKQYREQKCMGRRILKTMEKESKMVNGEEKTWETPVYEDEIEWKTYGEVDIQIRHIGSGIKTFVPDLQFQENVGIYMDTCAIWMQTALALWRWGAVVCTCYANLGHEALVHVINQCQLRVIVCEARNIDNLVTVKDQCPTLQTIIYTGTYKGEHSEDYKMISFPELTKLGKHHQAEQPTKQPDRSDLAVIMYTSGSTGMPKGVMHAHSSLIASAGALAQGIYISPKDTYLGYLPLAHILEMVAEMAMLFYGAPVGYGTPRTLTDRTTKPMGDLRAFSPSLMAGVPRVWETIRKGIQHKIENSSSITQYLFSYAYSKRQKAIQNKTNVPFWSNFIFKKPNEMVGGSLRCIVSGGAPLSAETQEFLNVTFDCPVIQGYGLTETCGGGCVQNPYGKLKTGRVGHVIRCSEIRLVDVPDMGYFNTDGTGEICIRGNNVALGYYKDPQKTAEVFKDGWFHTGDVGRWNKDGTLSIIDRIKNLVKLAHGEYVAVEALEMIYGLSPFVAPNGICVYGNSEKNDLVALVQPQVPYIEQYAKEHHLPLKDLFENNKLHKAILESLKAIALEHKKKKFEMVKKIYICQEEWTPENNMLTAAMKLKRGEIYKQHQAQLDALYEGLN